MEFVTGQLVHHPAWGLGKILKAEGAKLTIFFKDLSGRDGKDSNPKTISADHIPLELAAKQSDPWLDRLDIKVVDSRKPYKYLTHQNAVEAFLRRFPLGFNDPAYFSNERDYKWEAHQMWNELLSQQTFQQLIQEGNYAEAVRRALRVESKTNLMATFEKAALHEVVKDTQATKNLTVGLYDLIYGESAFENRFEQFTIVLENLPQPKTSTVKWPIQTIFLFLAYPERYLFLKPIVTQEVARLRAFDLHYDPRPNWVTYSCLLKFGELLMNDLAEMGPRDMIDVQSFMWVTQKY